MLREWKKEIPNKEGLGLRKVARKVHDELKMGHECLAKSEPGLCIVERGGEGDAAMVVFVVILVLALMYEWKYGALDWGIKTRTGLERK